MGLLLMLGVPLVLWIIVPLILSALFDKPDPHKAANDRSTLMLGVLLVVAQVVGVVWMIVG